MMTVAERDAIHAWVRERCGLIKPSEARPEPEHADPLFAENVRAVGDAFAKKSPDWLA